MKLPKWLYSLIIGLVSVLTTTSCSDSMEDEPEIPTSPSTFTESAWVLMETVEYYYYDNYDGNGMSVRGNETLETENTEILVLRKNLQADLWTLENDFSHSIPYQYTTQEKHFYFAPFADKENDDIRIGEWTIENDTLTITWSPNNNQTFVDRYKRIPYGEVDRWVDICKDYQTQKKVTNR